MAMPFRADQFLQVFALYNKTIWPIQVILEMLGAAAVGLLFTDSKRKDTIICFLLSFFWVWMAWGGRGGEQCQEA